MIFLTPFHQRHVALKNKTPHQLAKDTLNFQNMLLLRAVFCIRESLKILPLSEMNKGDYPLLPKNRFNTRKNDFAFDQLVGFY